MFRPIHSLLARSGDLLAITDKHIFTAISSGNFRRQIHRTGMEDYDENISSLSAESRSHNSVECFTSCATKPADLFVAIQSDKYLNL